MKSMRSIAGLAHLEHFVHRLLALLGGVANRRLERRPILLLVRIELEAGLHTGERGVEHRCAIVHHALRLLRLRRRVAGRGSAGKRKGEAREAGGGERAVNEFSHGGALPWL
jgi:hypothetical protein